MDLQELKSKVINERKELAEKIMRLTAKLYSADEETEKELISAYHLRKQLSIMTEYYDILIVRINDIKRADSINRTIEDLAKIPTPIECCKGRCDEAEKI